MIATLSRRLLTRESGSIRTTRRQTDTFWNRLLTAGVLFFGTVAAAHAANTLQKAEFSSLPGNKAQITLTMSQPAAAPLSFTIDNPARIALDFPDTTSKLADRSQNIGVGMAESMTVVEAKGRTRVVINLTEMVPYEAHADGNKVIVTVQNAGRDQSEAEAITAQSTGGATGNQVSNVDFRRGEGGEGRVIVTLSDPSIPVDIRQEAGKVLVDFYRAGLPKELARRMDVLDFATPVKTIDTFVKGDNVHMVITPGGDYDYIAYQSDNQFTIEVRKLSKKEVEDKKKDELGYSGERLSLNFQDIEVRSVLQLIADFTGINVVVSDTVKGSITLRLKNVPWDQALDIILKTKGLAMRKTGNVMLVAPSEEIAAREKLELESKKQIQELEPLYSEYIQINYAKADDIVKLLKSGDTRLMSERGMATTDQRTNTLLVQETAAKLAEIRKLIAQLDVPVRQVLIESRVVVADKNFSRDIGVTFNLQKETTFDNGNQFANGSFTATLPAAASPANSLFDFRYGKIGSHILDLALNASEAEGHTETISSPRVLTSNQKPAYIEVGSEVPYQEKTSSGATSTAFKKAVLSLNVTPQITPDDRIIMDLTINNDTVSKVAFNGVPVIDTNEVTSQVLVDNGETLVLGGVYTEKTVHSEDRTPILGEMPVINWLFKHTNKSADKQELLIFITPKIVKENFHI
jgi:type IV pilus assembly protein PilQ